MQADLPLTAAIRQSQQTLYHSHPQHSADRQGELRACGKPAVSSALETKMLFRALPLGPRKGLDSSAAAGRVASLLLVAGENSR